MKSRLSAFFQRFCRGHLARGHFAQTWRRGAFAWQRTIARATEFATTAPKLLGVADKEGYRSRLREAENVVEAHFASNGVPAEHGDGQRALDQAELWVGTLAGRPELPALNAAVDELDSGLHNLASGRYREAYGNLRLSLELFMAAIHFSVDELALRQWLHDKNDIIWSTLIKDVDKENHVLTTAFVSAFNDEMGGRWTQFRTIANTLHRELSVHVHGAASTRRSSRTLSFKRDVALDWLTKCQDAHLAWQYIAMARYTDLLIANKATLTSPFKDMLVRIFDTIEEAKDLLVVLGCK